MAANQTTNQRNRPGSVRSQGQPRRGPASEQEESSSAYGAIGDMAEQASGYVTQGAEQAEECIREHTAASVMFSLAAGFGIGFLIGKTIVTPNREPRSRRYRAMAEGFGTRLMDRMEELVPDAIAEYFGK